MLVHQIFKTNNKKDRVHFGLGQVKAFVAFEVLGLYYYKSEQTI